MAKLIYCKKERKCVDSTPYDGSTWLSPSGGIQAPTSTSAKGEAGATGQSPQIGRLRGVPRLVIRTGRCEGEFTSGHKEGDARGVQP